MLRENYLHHESFAEKMSASFGINLEHIDAADKDAGFSAISNCLHTVFSIALGKWLLSILFGGQPQWTIEMKETCSYTVRPGEVPDMFSFAFICRPVQQTATDKFGLSSDEAASSITPQNSEIFWAEKLIDEVNAVFDLDWLIFKDQTLQQELIEQAAALMKQANYDPITYMAEAKSQLQKVAQWLKNRDLEPAV